jgi:hypothetical protein
MSTGIRARLDAMQARAEAATEGPWEAVPTVRAAIVAFDNDDSGYWTDVADGFETEADAAFVAAARTDLPALLGFARDVLALHRPERPTGNLVTDATPSYCGGCYEAGGYDGAPLWEDCPVVALATRHLGGEA